MFKEKNHQHNNEKTQNKLKMNENCNAINWKQLEGLAGDEIRNNLREVLCFNAVYTFRAYCHSAYSFWFHNKVWRKNQQIKIQNAAFYCVTYKFIPGLWWVYQIKQYMINWFYLEKRMGFYTLSHSLQEVYIWIKVISHHFKIWNYVTRKLISLLMIVVYSFY